MSRRFRFLAIAAICTLLMVACGHGGNSRHANSNLRPSPAGSSIDVARECKQLYGKGATAIGKDGQPPTGWFCVKSNGRQAPFTVADMQRACDSQFRDAKAVRLSDNPNSGAANSTWRCLSKQQTTPIT